MTRASTPGSLSTSTESVRVSTSCFERGAGVVRLRIGVDHRGYCFFSWVFLFLDRADRLWEDDGEEDRQAVLVDETSSRSSA